MTEIEQVIEQLQASGRWGLASVFKEHYSSLITTIESQKEEIESWERQYAALLERKRRIEKYVPADVIAILDGLQESKPKLISVGWEARHDCTLFNAPGQFSCNCDGVCNEWLKSQEGDK